MRSEISDLTPTRRGLLDRRHLLGIGALIGAGCTVLKTKAHGADALAGTSQTGFARVPAGGALLAFSADDFVESVGVCSHLSSEPYASRPELLHAIIGDSGIRYLRDELRPDNDLGQWDRLYRAFGTRSHLLVSPATNSVREMMTYLANLGPARVSAIEGQNEGDSDWFTQQPQAKPNWFEAVVTYQREIYRKLRVRYSAAELPVLSPSVLDFRPEDVPLITAAAAYSDIVAIHPYVQHGQEPETADPYASVAWYLRAMGQAFKPDAPCMATEAGYANVVQPTSSGISEAAAARYLPRLLLHNFAAGVSRTFLYELIDGGTSRADPEDNYGLVRHDGVPKPSYEAVRDLLRSLADPGAPFVPSTVIIHFLDAPPDFRCLLFQKRGGEFVLAVWRTARCWDVATAKDVAVEPQPLVIAAQPSISNAKRLVPGMDHSWSRMAIVRDRITTYVDDRVALLRFSNDKRS